MIEGRELKAVLLVLNQTSLCVRYKCLFKEELLPSVAIYAIQCVYVTITLLDMT